MKINKEQMTKLQVSPPNNSNTIVSGSVSLDTFEKKHFGKVILLKNYNVVHNEIITYSKLKSKLIGLIWKYIPDSNFKNKRYMIVDVS